MAFSRDRCGGFVEKFFREWVNVEPGNNPPMQLVHGRVLASEFAGADSPFTHRNRDWNIYLDVDDQSKLLLSPANLYDWRDDSAVLDLQRANPRPMEIIELEWDSRFFPPQMAPEPGDDVLALGRWSFDCNHKGHAEGKGTPEYGYRTEIHPAALVLSVRVIEDSASLMRTTFKLFAASRGGPVNATYLVPLQNFWSSLTSPLAGADYLLELGPAETGWRVASCGLQAGQQTSGHRHIVNALATTSKEDSVIQMTVPGAIYHPSDRIESGIIIATTWVRSDDPVRRRGVTCKY